MSNSYTKDDTIFVQIASYRDPELQHTLQDLFKKAKRPENIFVGICHQYDMKGDEDKHLFEVPFPSKSQLRIYERDYRESEFGAAWSRHQAQKFYKDEKWVLVIDSHMRFEDGWDEIIVKVAKNIGKKSKAVLSSSVYGYELGDKDGSAALKYLANISCIKYETIMKMNGGSKIEITEPILASFLTTHFCFLEAETIKKVPFDPRIYFSGDEITMAVRLWTNGYNIFVPHKLILGHFYNLTTPYRKNHFYDHSEAWRWDKASLERVAHLCNTKKSNDPKALKELEHYSIGDSRTLKDYERFSGVNFRVLKVREKTRQIISEKWQEVSKIHEIKKIFKELSGNEACTGSN